MTTPDVDLNDLKPRDGVLLPPGAAEQMYVVDPNEIFDNLEEYGFKVVFCPWCGYSVTFDEAAFLSYDRVDWHTVLDWAIRHEHTA